MLIAQVNLFGNQVNPGAVDTDGMRGFLVRFKEKEEGILHAFRPAMKQKGTKIAKKTRC